MRAQWRDPFGGTLHAALCLLATLVFQRLAWLLCTNIITRGGVCAWLSWGRRPGRGAAAAACIHSEQARCFVASVAVRDAGRPDSHARMAAQGPLACFLAVSCMLLRACALRMPCACQRWLRRFPSERCACLQVPRRAAVGVPAATCCHRRLVQLTSAAVAHGMPSQQIKAADATLCVLSIGVRARECLGRPAWRGTPCTALLCFLACKP